MAYKNQGDAFCIFYKAAGQIQMYCGVQLKNQDVSLNTKNDKKIVLHVLKSNKMNQRRILLSILLVLFQISLILAQEWQTDLDKAQQIATTESKNIVLVFSGSDWCAPCMKLENEIWNSDEFKTYAKDNFVMLRADFPRKKANRLSEEQEKTNGQLAEKYNQEGYFPLVVVMNQKLTVLGKTGYKKMAPAEYIKHLNSFIR